VTGAATEPRSAVMTVLAVLGVLALVAAGAWFLMIRMPGASHAGPLAPLAPAQEEMRQRLEADVRHFAETLGERSVWQPQALAAAASHIESTLAGLGYRVESQAYDSHGVPVRNIEATLGGTVRPQDIVLLGAHYDSVRGTAGANDNASGSAALLEIARQLAGQPLARTVRLVAFVNEEPPHFNVGEMGSGFYARAAAARGDRIVAMLSLETLGYYSDQAGSQRYPFPFGLLYPDRGDFVAFVGNIASRGLVRRSLAAFRGSTAFPSEGVAAPAFVPGVYWSDHASFWEQGYPALMVTDTALFRYPYYHTSEDLPRHVDFARLARVVGGLTDVGRALAQAP